MKNILLLGILLYSIQLISQDVIRPQCDEALEIPYTLSYNGFIILQNANEFGPQSNFSLEVKIVEDNINGNELFSEIHSVPFEKSGFFSVDIGTRRPNEFRMFMDYLNQNTDKVYFIDVHMKQNNAINYVYIGSKKIETVPYALVANALNGLGKQGPPGEKGQQGIQGERGVQGLSGISGPDGTNGLIGKDGFDIMLMRNTVPSSPNLKFYIDDGTNTEDGQPHVRYYNDSENKWIDL